MANSNVYDWTFTTLDVVNSQGSYNNVVYIAHWILKGSDPTTSHSAQFYGAQELSPYNPDSGSFVPFESLTKNIVEGWVKDAMGPKYGMYTSSIDNDIQEQINPSKKQVPPPWQT